jgi:hypothetical protein
VLTLTLYWPCNNLKVITGQYFVATLYWPVITFKLLQDNTMLRQVLGMGRTTNAFGKLFSRIHKSARGWRPPRLVNPILVASQRSILYIKKKRYFFLLKRILKYYFY